MIKDIVWMTFEKTGDLDAYLLLKELENSKSEEKKEQEKE